jgi:DNA polymerase I-like protein with 3'-5' exonuclease and polymerase domains
MRYLAVDCESLGIDFYHGARPFFWTFCDEEDNQVSYEWEVDPLTRKVEVIESDVDEMIQLIEDADNLVLQNPKFDRTALAMIRPDFEWPWYKTLDTLRAAHILASNQPHDLTTLAIVYLRENIKPYEDALEVATKRAQSIARSKLPTWRVAKKGEEDMPSAKGKVWKFDGFLPRTFCRLAPELLEPQGEWQRGDDPMKHPWATVLSTYGNWDSTVTVHIIQVMLKILKERGLEKIYAECMRVLSVAYKMEKRGITVNNPRLEKMYDEFKQEADRLHRVCLGLADNEIEKLPVSGTSNALKYVLLDKFKLVSSEKTDSGQSSLNKVVLEKWSHELPDNSKACHFVKNLLAYRRRMTAISYMDGYKRFWLPLNGDTSNGFSG